MPRKKQRMRSRAIPDDYQEKITESREKAKKRAINLLEHCLNTYRLNQTDQSEFLQVVAESIGIVDYLTTDSSDTKGSSRDSDHDGRVSKSKNGTHRSTKENRSNKYSDEHNEVCEVCETGGDLLCCDTCSLVFHLGCLRPKISVIPKGKWSCAHCIVDGITAGDVQAAKKALKSMRRVASGLDSGDDDKEQTSVSSVHQAKSSELTVARSGKKFIVRKNVRSNIIELGRFGSLEDAFCSFKDGEYKGRIPEIGVGSGNYKRHPPPVKDSDEDDEGLWCIHCMDDASITVCAFCGCQACFSKHDSEYLLLCDACDEEYHTYCLQPQLLEIPDESWYCHECVTLGRDEEEEEEEDVEEGIDEEEDDEEEEEEQVVVPRRPGRPKGSTSAAASATYSDSKYKLQRQSLLAPDQPPTASRGRGRPPGSGKRGKEMADTLAITTSSATKAAAPKVPPVPLTASKSSAGKFATANASADVSSSYKSVREKRSSHEPMGVSQGTREQGGSVVRGGGSGRKSGTATINCASHSSSSVPSNGSSISSATTGNRDFEQGRGQALALQPGGAGVAAAVEVVAKLTRRCFTQQEKGLLQQVRMWAPLEDLETVMQSLNSQREALFAKILALDPSFDVSTIVAKHSVADNKGQKSLAGSAPVVSTGPKEHWKRRASNITAAERGGVEGGREREKSQSTVPVTVATVSAMSEVTATARAISQMPEVEDLPTNDSLVDNEVHEVQAVCPTATMSTEEGHVGRHCLEKGVGLTGEGEVTMEETSACDWAGLSPVGAAERGGHPPLKRAKFCDERIVDDEKEANVASDDAIVGGGIDGVVLQTVGLELQGLGQGVDEIVVELEAEQIPPLVADSM